MKKSGGLLVVSRLDRCKGRWCRRLLALCVATETRNVSTSPLVDHLTRRGSPETEVLHRLKKSSTGQASWPAHVAGSSAAASHVDSDRLARYEGATKVGNLRDLCRQGQLSDACQALDLLLQQRTHVSTGMFYDVLKGCIAQKDLDVGRRVHALAVRAGYDSNTFVATNLIRMYRSQGSLLEAQQVFRRLPAPDSYVWASIILAHAEHGQPKQAIQLYRQMQESTVKPDNHIFVAVLKACARAEDLGSGKQVHADVMKSNGKPNLFVGNTLLHMYSKCGSLEDARRVFDLLCTRDVVAWNAMIAGYAQQGLGREALNLYARMCSEGVVLANRATYVCLLKACASIGAVHEGKQVHAEIRGRGMETDLVVGTSLVDMYVKCGYLEDARRVFDKIPTRDVIICNAMLAGYAHHGLGHEALSLYASLSKDAISIEDTVTFVCLLKACASIGALQEGMQLHRHAREAGLEADVAVGTSLVDMYAKCGSLESARRAFDRLATRDVAAWTALLNGYGQHNDCRTAIQCFHEMQQHGVQPNDATFICLLVACSHEGLVNEGKEYFKQMVEIYGISPSADHYNCMVDLLGRSGHMAEAEALLESMPFKDNPVGWKSLLSACKSHGDVECGKRCFNHLVNCEPQEGSGYVLMSSIYANANRWEDVDMTDSSRKSAGAFKKPARTWIQIDSKVHEFVVGEDRDDVSSKLRSLNLRLKEEGHVAHTELVLKPISDKEKEDALCGHAEKLALAYGLLNTPEGTPLVITKNLRMCNDCHSGTKILSKIEGCEIVVRDAHHVHRFRDGVCSCQDSR